MSNVTGKLSRVTSKPLGFVSRELLISLGKMAVRA